MRCFDFEWLQLVNLLVILQGLEQVLPDEVAFDHRRCVLHKAAENLPRRVSVAFPFDFELNEVFRLLFVHTMADDALDTVPAPLLRLLGLGLWLFELKRVDLLHERFRLIQLALVAPLSYWLAEVGYFMRLMLNWFVFLGRLSAIWGVFFGRARVT